MTNVPMTVDGFLAQLGRSPDGGQLELEPWQREVVQHCFAGGQRAAAALIVSPDAYAVAGRRLGRALRLEVERLANAYRVPPHLDRERWEEICRIAERAAQSAAHPTESPRKPDA